MIKKRKKKKKEADTFFSPPFVSLKKKKKHSYRQRGELVTAQVQRLQLSPLVDAEGQF